jgi:hypothetical protein
VIHPLVHGRREQDGFPRCGKEHCADKVIRDTGGCLAEDITCGGCNDKDIAPGSCLDMRDITVVQKGKIIHEER